MTNELSIKNKDLLALYADSVNAGTEEAGESGVYPMVKITAALSKENVLSNGKRSEIGKLFHTELKQDFDSIKANICYVGKFELPDFNTKEPKLTYVIGAVMEDNSPFVMFVKGFSLQNVWQFLGEVSNIKNRYQIPMYALQVNIESVPRPHEKFSSVDVFKFNIKRDEDGTPAVETNLERAGSLRLLTDKFQEVARTMTRKNEETDEYVDQANGGREYDDYEAEDVSDQVPL